MRKPTNGEMNVLAVAVQSLPLGIIFTNGPFDKKSVRDIAVATLKAIGAGEPNPEELLRK